MVTEELTQKELQNLIDERDARLAVISENKSGWANQSNQGSSALSTL